MAAKRGRFEEIYRQKTQAGESTFSAFKSTAAERRKELTDLRRMFPSSGILGAMLESAFGKAYKYKGKGSAGVAGKDSTPIDNKTLNVIRLNTAVTAKNSMVLPGMARDMNVMRQNIVKMAKQTTGSAATRADAFFLKAKERENAYETQIAGKSPSRADGKQSGKDNEKGGFFSGLLGSILSMSLKDMIAGLLKGGLIAGILVGIGKYFTDPEFRKSVNDMINNLGEAVFGSEYWEKLKKDIQDNLVDGALIVGGSYLAFKVASNLLSTAVTALATNISSTLARFLAHPAVIAMGVGISAIKAQGVAEVNAAKKNLKYAEEGDLEKLKLGVAESYLDENYDKNLGYNPGKSKEDKNLDKMERAEVRKLLQKAVAGGSKKAQNALNRLDASYGIGPTMNKEQQEVQNKIDTLIAEREALKTAKPADSEAQKLRISQEISKLQKQKRELRGVSPTVEPSADTGVSGNTPTQVTSNVKFSDLSPEQQLIVIREQRRQEGFYPGSTSYDLNNPGNMVYSEQTAKFGAIKDPTGKRGTGDVKGKLAQFPSLEAGEAAQRDLLANGVNYRNLSLDEALKRWTGSQKNPQESANYRSNIFAKLQLDHTDAVNNNTEAVIALKDQMKEEKSATMTEMLAALIQSMGNSGTTVNNVNNTSVASAGSVASPYNEDMLALFKQRASVGL